jgi:hypothetical protein
LKAKLLYRFFIAFSAFALLAAVLLILSAPTPRLSEKPDTDGLSGSKSTHQAVDSYTGAWKITDKGDKADVYNSELPLAGDELSEQEALDIKAAMGRMKAAVLEIEKANTQLFDTAEFQDSVMSSIAIAAPSAAQFAELSETLSTELNAVEEGSAKWKALRAEVDKIISGFQKYPKAYKLLYVKAFYEEDKITYIEADRDTLDNAKPIDGKVRVSGKSRSGVSTDEGYAYWRERWGHIVSVPKRMR